MVDRIGHVVEKVVADSGSAGIEETGNEGSSQTNQNEKRYRS